MNAIPSQSYSSFGCSASLLHRVEKVTNTTKMWRDFGRVLIFFGLGFEFSRSILRRHKSNDEVRSLPYG
jgi:hypothetical protein